MHIFSLSLEKSAIQLKIISNNNIHEDIYTLLKKFGFYHINIEILKDNDYLTNCKI